MSDLSKRGKALAGLAGKKVLAALNRADEIGGEVRDYLQENVFTEERIDAVKSKVADLTGRSTKVEPGFSVTPAAANPAAGPAAAAPKAKGTGTLGDPSWAAQIYGRESCPWSGRARSLLNKHKIDYDFVDMDEPENGTFETVLVAETKQNTVPYIYLRGTFIGGFNALSEIERSGQLDFSLMTAEDRAAHPLASKFVLTPRPNTDETAPAQNSDPASEAE